jgi:heme exporter protein D
MIAFIVLVVAVVCLGVGFVMGRRSGIESEIRRQLRDDRRDY